LTDNEVAVFKITLPDDEFTLLKEKAVYAKNDEHFGNVRIFTEITNNIEAFMEKIPTINFKQLYPNYDLNVVLPELQVDKNGFSKIDAQQIMDHLDLNMDHYHPDESDTLEKVLLSYPDFNLYEMIKTLADLKMAKGVKVSEDYTSFLDTIKNGNDNTLEKRDEEVAEEVAAQFKTKNATMIAEING